MLITNQKVASEVFELNEIIAEEQSDEFNIYEDSVEGISEMSDNAESSSDWNDNSSASEKTCIRLEIARLQYEVE
ncbi:hypothetical protein BDBG_17474 [Blastomyces gilchristii SLH14081]|uniref:Uncharacterized protein n=1 Tax=Blastomyces gilchristii (strain SLH14081) TaxID=559298 RepID=A0A179UTQ6_BLAGS|nr:uncharacterized protein BDBG_17474 [Blastomyces gilchristii SLH14081]OAT11240.1 hypothetical protein BDBG_17474 [Blastomyces gilchristii SLH14081]